MLQVINRDTGQVEVEKVYFEKALHFVYGDSWYQKIALIFISRIPLFSYLYGMWQSMPYTKWKITKFVERFDLDMNQFEERNYTSFNDFFMRKLKPGSRQIASGDTAIIPADGRYCFYQHIDQSDGFIVKGKKFCLESFLKDPKLAEKYKKGSMVIGRLAPSDYHRVHFPCDGVPSLSRLVNGCLYSVNPYALKKNIEIFTENKRRICHLETEKYGKVLMVEIGATNVGSIYQSYTPERPVEKGMEKAYFSFGGSAVVLLFEQNKAIFSADLLAATKRGLEIRCLMGQPMAFPNDSI